MHRLYLTEKGGLREGESRKIYRPFHVEEKATPVGTGRRSSLVTVEGAKPVYITV